MVAGLVAMDISADQAVFRDVLVLGVGIFREVVVEELVEIRDKLFLTAHKFHYAIDILRGMEAEIQRVALDKSLSHRLHDVEVLLVGAVLVFRPGVA